ncbi:S-layer homology domain-containing protein [Niallia oryzisoli]|uniref:S-layer homology domain-containing protein n=1 Tax=Niallia oryzisoli TaxID=1737571 RepID=A0ABZ2CEL8_9BACI
MAYQPKLYRPFVAGAVVVALVGYYCIPVVHAAGFSDIDDNTHKESILVLAEQKVIRGFEDGTFRPYQHISRGDAAVMVARTLGLLNGNNIPDNSFTDLQNANTEMREAIAKLVKLDILSGFSEEFFHPHETVTRAQMAKYIANAFDLPIKGSETDFPDVNPNAILAPYVAAIAEAGITIGKENGTFGYHDPLNRGDFSAMLYRAHFKEPEPVITPITIEGDEQGNTLVNGQAKTYTVTLINPVSEEPIENAVLNVTFAENLETNFGPQRNVVVTNGHGQFTIPYQSKDGYEAEIEIKTDKMGKATFTITGINATVTPIVFLDGSNQEWDTKGGIKIETQNSRFEEIEYHTKAAPVTFTITPYQITVEGQRTNYAAIADMDENGLITEHNGRKYKIKVTKPDGTPYAGGTVNVGIDELLDGKLGNEPYGAYFVDFKNAAGKHLTQGQVGLDYNGEASFVLASKSINVSAKPIVWIDQNFANNDQPGTLESGEPISDQSLVEPTNFQPARVDNGILGAELSVIQDNYMGEKIFQLTILNQSGKVFNLGKEVKAHVTFEVINTGTHPVEINTSFLSNLELTHAMGAVNNDDIVTIEVGGRVTISGDTPVSTVTLLAQAVEGISTVKVKGSAVLYPDVGYESNSVYVYTDYVEVELPFSYTADIESIIAQDTNNNGTSDQVEITFGKEVHHFEAGDFRIRHEGDAYSANSVTKDGKKLILTFPEVAFNNSTTTLFYDPHYSGTEVLTDGFGNKVVAFQIGFTAMVKEDNEENADVKKEENSQKVDTNPDPILDETLGSKVEENLEASNGENPDSIPEESGVKEEETPNGEGVPSSMG